MGLRERKKARTRAAIRTEAMRLFRERGYAATTIEQIAAAADISPATFFRYYPTKEDVVLQDDLDVLLPEAVEAQPPSLGPIAAVRAAVAQAAGLLPGLPLLAGGKSFGARMTSQAQAAAPLSGVRGLAFLGFPLHPPGTPSDERGAHLFDVRIPMLFLQGTRDEFAELPLLKALVAKLGARATLKLFDDADHSFHVPARTGRKDSGVRAELADSLVAWIDNLASAAR